MASNNFPIGPLRNAIKTRLDNNISVPVVVQKQKQGKSENPPFVMIETPPAERREAIKTSVGFEVSQTIRVHTRYIKGKADLSKREDIASNVDDALEPDLSVSGHNIMRIPTPNVFPQDYEADGQHAYDLLLQYEFRTQTL